MNLTLALFAFFITCAFSAPTQDPIKATTLQYVTRISMWVVQATLVVDVVFLLFFIFCVIRNEIDWLKMVTNVWTARQFIVLQVILFLNLSWAEQTYFSAEVHHHCLLSLHPHQRCDHHWSHLPLQCLSLCRLVQTNELVKKSKTKIYKSKLYGWKW